MLIITVIPLFTFPHRVKDTDTRLMLWDTAGQEEFDAITKAYYRGMVWESMHLSLLLSPSKCLDGWTFNLHTPPVNWLISHTCCTFPPLRCPCLCPGIFYCGQRFLHGHWVVEKEGRTQCIEMVPRPLCDIHVHVLGGWNWMLAFQTWLHVVWSRV